MTNDRSNDETPVIADVAGYFYEVCELWEDDDLDPEDHAGIVRRAFMSSDCDDLAWLLSEALGWQAVRMSWTIPNWGFGHHTLVRSPDGRLADVRGWTEEEAVRDYFGLDGRTSTTIKNVDLDAPLAFEAHPEDGHLQMIVSAVSNLGVSPFDDPEVLSSIERFVAKLGDDISP